MLVARTLSCCCLFLFFTTHLAGQQNARDALDKLFDDYPQEKIYLWFNKPAYVAGETIWFKAYVFSGYDISFLSSSLYVELYDTEKKLITTRLLPLVSGISEGSIDLGDKLDENVYYIRAYTQWMLNFDEAFQYIHPLLVYNPASRNHLMLKNTHWKAGAFPEGGVLINGVESKIAVRRYSEAPLQDKWSGYLFEENDPTRKLKEFSSLDENAGLFSFIPEAGKKYSLHVADQDGNFQVCSLPAVELSGVSLSIDEISDSINYTLRFRNIPGNGNGYSVVGEVQHQLVYQANLKKTRDEITMKIGALELKNGILHLTVFSPAMKPVLERLVFLNRHKLYFDSTSVAQYNLSAQPRSVSDLQVNIDSTNWISYGVSVLDEAAPSPVLEENILSALWLTGDLSTLLQNPARYFTSPDKNKLDALDAIMISEKWIRFDWNEILNDRFPKITHHPLNYLSYTGRVRKGNKLRPHEEITLLLYYPDSTTRMCFGQTDSVGNITMDNVIFHDEIKVFYQLNSKKSNARFIDIDFERLNRFVAYTAPLPQTPYTLTTEKNTPPWVENTLATMKMKNKIDEKYKSLQEVVVQSKLKTAKEKLDEKLSSPLFRNSFNQYVFDFVNEQQNAMGYTNILQWLQGRVAGLEIRRVDGSYVPFIRGGQAKLYIDEMPVDPMWADNIPVSNIAMVKVIKGPSVALGGAGIVAIYTMRGGMQQFGPKESSLPNSRIKGYDPIKKFFQPDYNDKTLPEPDEDTRNQLLWSTLVAPSVSPDRATISFFNNDSTKRFRVIVQGFTEGGDPVFFEKILSPVQKSF